MKTFLDFFSRNNFFLCRLEYLHATNTPTSPIISWRSFNLNRYRDNHINYLSSSYVAFLEVVDTSGFTNEFIDLLEF